jgi:hypothetical protein
MTDQEENELNEQVARAMGWTSREAFLLGASPMMGRTKSTYRTTWTPPMGVKSNDFDNLPDFCRDSHAVGWLLEWLKRESIDLVLTADFTDSPDQWDCSARLDQSKRAFGFYSTPNEALCRAIIAYAKAE